MVEVVGLRKYEEGKNRPVKHEDGVRTRRSTKTWRINYIGVKEKVYMHTQKHDSRGESYADGVGEHGEREKCIEVRGRKNIFFPSFFF